MADPAPSEDKAASSDGASAGPEDDAGKTPPKVDGAAFANTKQHVASRYADGGTTERFVNTKLNIALINDPKNGPRFTLTKRESGLKETESGGDAPPEDDQKTPQKPADRTEPDQASSRSGSTPASDPPAPAAAPSRADAAAATAPPDARPRHQTPAPAPGEPPFAIPPMASTARAPSGMPPVAEPPSKVPIDSSKTFVGPNGSYYDESWRWMDWRGTRRSWNWPAALSFGHWFAYRRLHVFAGLHLLWLAGLTAAAVNDVPVIALVVVALLMVGLIGVYGNTLYFLAFRRAVDHVTQHGEGSYQELRGQLAAAGGTSTPALGVMAALSILAIVGALGATFYLRGGLLFNFWPFF